MKTRGFASIAAAVLVLCAVSPLSAKGERPLGGPDDGATAATCLAALPSPPAPTPAQHLLTGRRIVFQRLRIARSLSLDREGRIYVDFNRSISFGIKPFMGSIELLAGLHDPRDFLRGLSASIYVHY